MRKESMMRPVLLLVFLAGCAVATSDVPDPRTTVRSDLVTNGERCPDGTRCEDPFECSSLPGRCAYKPGTISAGELDTWR